MGRTIEKTQKMQTATMLFVVILFGPPRLGAHLLDALEEAEKDSRDPDTQEVARETLRQIDTQIGGK